MLTASSLCWARQIGKLSRCVSVPATSRQRNRSSHRKGSPRAKRYPKMSLNIAINGCGHGELDTIYATIQDIEKRTKKPVDLLICCGDFQAMRNVDDLHCFAAPPKYRAMMDFHRYYSGEKVAPVPTLFVGGNHEAANYLWELYYGGWAAPNILYLGAAGVVNFGGLRIGGLTGIYKPHHYTAGHFEQPPYDDSTVRSAYHVRDLEVYRLLKLKEAVDVMVSHDWPTNVPRYGNSKTLLRCKPDFRKEVDQDALGSPPNWQLLQTIKPRYWFSGHLHVHFSAAIPHSTGNVPGKPATLPPESSDASSVTRFLAVDKPIPRRRFVQIVQVPVNKPGPKAFTYDEEWLAILRETHDLLSLSRRPTRFPTPLHSAPEVAAEHRQAISSALKGRGSNVIPVNSFVQTVDAAKRGLGDKPTSIPRNPQTLDLLDLIGRQWNLGGERTTAASPSGHADGRIQVADLFGDADVASDEESNGGEASDDPMFQRVEIHNFDPHAISDARKSLDSSMAKTPGHVTSGLNSVGVVSERVLNPEELDIDDD